jgi:hypothetical protein
MDYNRGTIEEEMSMNYERYCEICFNRKIQPLRKEAFEAMIKAGFNFETGRFD